MEADFNFLNILTLFGAVQGFILCILLYRKRDTNRLAVDFFLLFLFSLSFYNLIYACYSMDLFRYHRPLHIFPYPFKWLIGAGFYFYVKNQFSPKEGVVYHKKEWYLLLPAAVYLVLRIYWFAVAVSEDSYRIIEEVIETDFFRIQEFFILIFNTGICISLFGLIKRKKAAIPNTLKTDKVIRWLRNLTLVFLTLSLLNLVLYTVDLIIHDGQETFDFIYPTLIGNVLFIYWIGFIGYTKSGRFFNRIHMADQVESISILSDKIKHAMEFDRLYENPNLSVSQLASEMQISAKELSKHINDNYHMNFSEFVNHHRVEAVKKLLSSSEAKKYTLVTLAEIAGFSSKSSFNASFKKITGLTPSEYRKRRQ